MKTFTGPRSRAQRLSLETGQVGAALLGEREQRVQLGPVERRTLRGALHLDERALAGHHDVHVGLGADVLDVRQVESGYAVDDADADRGDGAGQRLALEGAGGPEVGDGV